MDQHVPSTVERLLPELDHLALAVPDLDELVDCLTASFGFDVTIRLPTFAVLVDERSNFKLELNATHDNATHLRHLGFRADDVDAIHADLVATGMTESAVPHRQDAARMYTSSLQAPSGLEIQLVDYDDQ